MDGAELDAMKDALADHQTKAFLVIRNDKIVYEWYQKGHGPDKRHYTASMAKAIVGGVSLAVAMSDDLIELDDQIAKYIPRWKDHPRKSKITIRHLGSHTSEDHAKTWTGHGVLFEETKGRFGNIFTIQYGKDYTDIPSFQGGYIYLYGMENKDPTVDKDFLLARCDKRRLKKRSAYEFFDGTSEKPSWTGDLSKARSIFHMDDGVSWWASCTYTRQLARYILLTTHPPFAGRHNDHKGFGMFESQRPWGPWKTVVYTQDVGTIIQGMTEGISYVIPAKWILDEGKTMWMVFSERPSEPFYSFNLIKINLDIHR